MKGRTGTGSVIAPQPSNLAPFQVLRRGLREPDVMEALGSKRLYVAQLPHIVTGELGCLVIHGMKSARQIAHSLPRRLMHVPVVCIPHVCPGGLLISC